jgi:hypothetical protein
MRSVRNATRTPLAVPLPGGKTLHLGPGMVGEISARAAEHPPLAALVAAGALTLLEGGQRQVEPTPGPRLHGSRAGHLPHAKGGRRGDR